MQAGHANRRREEGATLAMASPAFGAVRSVGRNHVRPLIEEADGGVEADVELHLVDRPVKVTEHELAGFAFVTQLRCPQGPSTNSGRDAPTCHRPSLGHGEVSASHRLHGPDGGVCRMQHYGGRGLGVELVNRLEEVEWTTARSPSPEVLGADPDKSFPQLGLP
jgi:hypothetical protein